MKNILLFAAAALIIFSSCNEIFAKRIKGNGNIVTRQRTTGNFSSVHLSGGNIDVYAKQDSATSVKVETDENLQDYLEIRVDGDVLRIQPREGYNLKSREPIKVMVSAPQFKHFQSSGAGDIFSEGKINSAEKIDFDMSGSSKLTMDIDAPAISADMSGAGNINLKGQTKDLKISMSGSADIKCFDLMAENADVSISGAGDAELFASVSLKARISGAGDIRYRGNPSVDKHVSGAGSIRKVD